MWNNKEEGYGVAVIKSSNIKNTTCKESQGNINLYLLLIWSQFNDKFLNIENQYLAINQ